MMTAIYASGHGSTPGDFRDSEPEGDGNFLLRNRKVVRTVTLQKSKPWFSLSRLRPSLLGDPNFGSLLWIMVWRSFHICTFGSDQKEKSGTSEVRVKAPLNSPLTLSVSNDSKLQYLQSLIQQPSAEQHSDESVQEDKLHENR